MSTLQALVMGLLQGVTEFLPVSSSGHLVIVPWLLGWPTASLTFDTMVHWGTLVAVFVYFWQDVVFYVRAAVTSLARRSLDVPGARVAWAIAAGTVPGALAGALLEEQFEALFQSPRAAAAFLLVTALVLAVSERLGKRQRKLASVTLLDGVLIGVGQALAITPGLSRSGTTIATGLARGLERDAAARFSFLLGIPLIFGAGLFKLKDVWDVTATHEPLSILALGFVAAAVSGYLAIHSLLRYVRRHSLYVFAVYCAVFGLAVLVLT